MSDRKRFYLTTAIAYANNAPGLHTVYEVIGADVIARWHRMQGDDTRFLTGTDEHSVNIAQSAEALGTTPKAFVDEKVELFKAAEDALLISPDRFIRTTDPDHYRVGPGHRPARLRQRRHLPRTPTRAGTARARGSRTLSDLHETARGMECPNHPTVPLQWLSERNWFFRLSAYQDRLLDHYDENPDFVQPDYRRNEMLGFIRGGPRGLLDQPRPARLGHPVPDRRERRDRPARGRVVGSRGGHDLRLVRRADQLHHRRRLPRRPRRVRTTGGRPTSTSSARTSPGSTRSIWPAMLWCAGHRAAATGLGPRLLLACRRRADEQEPRQLPRPGRRGRRVRRRRRALRRPSARSRSTGTPRSAGTSFVRRYNADLANDFGNLVNRTVSMVNRYLGGERPAPRPAGDSPLGEGWAETLRAVRGEARRLPPPRRARGELWEFVGGGEQDRRRRAAVGRSQKAAKARRRGGGRRGCASVLGDLVEAVPAGRARGRAVHARRPRRGSSPSWATPTRTRPTATAAAAARRAARWGAHAGEAGPRDRDAEPLFPRMDVEAVETPGA